VGYAYRAVAEKVETPPHSGCCVWIVPLTVPPENLPVITWTIAGGPGPVPNFSAMLALNVPLREIEAALPDWLCSFSWVLQ